MAAFIPFPATYITTGIVRGPDGHPIADIRPQQLATRETAERVAALLGGVIEEIRRGFPFPWSHVEYSIRIPSTGALLNAGAVASLLNKYGAQQDSYAWTVIRADMLLWTPPLGPEAFDPPPPPLPRIPAPAPGATPAFPGLPVAPAPARVGVGPVGPAPAPGPNGAGGFAPAAGPPVAKVLIAVFAALGGLFSGRISRNQKRAFEGVRASIIEIGDALLGFSWRIARAFGWLVRTVQTIWVRILRPLIEHVQRIARRLRDIIDRVLKPYLRILDKIRAYIDFVYGRYVRPIIDAIQVVRRALVILRIARIKAADDLDKWLARLQGQIAAPLLWLLQRTNELAGWINVLLTVQMLLQQPLLVNSLDHYRGFWVRSWWAAHAAPLSAKRRQAYLAAAPAPGVGKAAELAAAALLDDSGPLAAGIQQAIAAARAELAV